jgi:hypothetical protein
MKRARKAQTSTAHFKKDSAAAHERMAELRAMRGGDNMEGGFLKGSAEAIAHGAKMRAARKDQDKYVKGHPAARVHAMANTWIVEVQNFRKAHPELSYKEAMMGAAQARREHAVNGPANKKRAWKAKDRQWIDAI